nr:MAG TPA: helix-turn-helix domain protein [Caudoviricetes sp.]
MNIENLKNARKKAGLTQAQAAEAIGVNDGTYKNYEQGKREPNGDKMVAIANLFGVTTDYLLGRPGAAPPIDGLSEMIAQNAANDIEKTLLEMYFGLDAKKRGAFLQELVDVVNQNQKNSESENEIAITEERNHTHIARIVANDGNNREVPVTDEDESEIADLLYEIEQQQRKK